MSADALSSLDPAAPHYPGVDRTVIAAANEFARPLGAHSHDRAQRDKVAAVKLMRSLRKRHGFAPDVLVPDKLRSYATAKSELRLTARYEQGQRRNNRAENSHLMVLRRERKMERFKDQRNGSCPLMPQSRRRSTSNAISFPAIRSALSEAKRFRIGGRRREPETRAPSPSILVPPEPVCVTTPLSSCFSSASSPCASEIITLSN